MKRWLQSVGRVIEYDKCYQVVDATHLSCDILNKLHNHKIEIKSCASSLSGYELIVHKQLSNEIAYAYVFVVAVVAVVFFLCF